MSAWKSLNRPSTWLGLVSVLLLCGIAIENLTFTDTLTGMTYHRTQTIWIVLGLMAAGVVASMDVAFVRKLSPTLYQVVVVLLAAVLVVGREINYSRRWIELGPANIQPSEFMKLSIILMLADYFDRKRANSASLARHLLAPVALMMLPVVLINLEPDLGTSLCVALVAASIILYDGIHGRTLMAGLVVVMLAVPVAWEFGVIRNYQKGRVEAWLSLDEEAVADKRSAQSSQAEQALWAVGSGKFSGRSDGDARSSVLRHLPFLHTDFALAAYAERFGLLGCFFLFGLYAAIVAWALHLADHAQERFDALVAVGVAALIFWQFFINAGMVIGLLPVVGLTLPLVSYGGSSSLTVLLGIGFLVNIATRRKSR